MIPDMRTNFAKADLDTDAQEQVEAKHAKWQAELRLFKWQLNPRPKTRHEDGVRLPCTPRHLGKG